MQNPIMSKSGVFSSGFGPKLLTWKNLWVTVFILAWPWIITGCVTPIAKEVVKISIKQGVGVAAKEGAEVGMNHLSGEKSESTSTPTPTATKEVSPTPTSTPFAILQVTAQQISDDYNKDRSKADQKYNGVVLEVIGEIARVKKDDRHYIIFHIAGGPDNVRCNLASGQVDEWERLNEGDRVVIVGTGVGKRRGPWGDFNIDACFLNSLSQ